MRKAVLILVVLAACSSGGGWSDAEKEAFTDSCEAASGGLVAVCACALEKAQEKADTPEDLTTDEQVQIGEECAKQEGNN